MALRTGNNIVHRSMDGRVRCFQDEIETVFTLLPIGTRKFFLNDFQVEPAIETEMFSDELRHAPRVNPDAACECHKVSDFNLVDLPKVGALAECLVALERTDALGSLAVNVFCGTKKQAGEAD